MGTPEFAVASLDILYNAGYNIVGVITSVDKLGRRGRKTLIESAVKKYAVEKGLKVMQPTNLKSKKFNAELKELKADVQIVVAFRMLPVMVWDMPPLGTYNLHGSLLPKYRGAAPINWAVINGETQTGVTTFKLKHEIDTGSILMQKKIPIYYSDNATEVHNRMMYVGADLILETVKKLEEGAINLKEQNNIKTSHAPKLNKENTEIDFTKNTDSVYNFIRGLSLYPAAWFKIGDKTAKVYSSTAEKINHEYEPGKIISNNKNFIKIACSDGWITINEIQLSGKRKMSVKEFLNGYDIQPYI